MSSTRSPIRIAVAACAAFVLALAFPAGAHINTRPRHNWNRHYLRLAQKSFFTEDELQTPGTLNDPGNPVDWTKLANVPGDLADGDDTGGLANDLDCPGCVDTADLANDAVTSAKIENGTVLLADLGFDPATQQELNDYVPDWNDLANVPGGFADGVDDTGGTASDLICDPVGCVGTADLAGDAVTSGKIGAGEVDTADLANGAVTDAKASADLARTADLSTSDGDGPNLGSNQVHWFNLHGMPGGFADGMDNTGGTASDVVCNGCVGTSDLAPGEVNESRLSFDPATQAELNNHATSGDHDDRYWALGGNAGTTPGTDFLGTTDAQSLVFKVNGEQALLVSPDPESPNLIGGSELNVLFPGVEGAVIAGGGGPTVNVDTNRVSEDFATVGGGYDNIAGDLVGTTIDRLAPTVGGGVSNTASGLQSTISGGGGNTASGQSTTIGGGANNSASFANATIGGGANNSASGNSSTIGGGGGNIATGGASTVAGGGPNTAGGSFSAIGGGTMNTTPGTWATIGGGSSNSATVTNSTVSGGANNVASGGAAGGATVGGGTSNNASGARSTIGGGASHVASGVEATVGGGTGNSATSPQATVAGGSSNSASGEEATVSGGGFNSATADWATIGGGLRNHIAARYATIGGGAPSDLGDVNGTRNLVTDEYGTVGGGGDNQAGDDAGTSSDRSYATVGGGIHNTASGQESTVGGGSLNSASARLAAVGGGGSNTAGGEWSVVAGGLNNTAAGEAAAIGGGASNTIPANPVGCALCTLLEATIAGGAHNTASGGLATVGGGQLNVASGSASTIPGGNMNKASGQHSFAAGRRANADHHGGFVWADSCGGGNPSGTATCPASAVDHDFVSTALDQFSARATGGVRFVTAVDGTSSPSAGVSLSPGASAWAVISDRASKENVAVVDGRGVLAALANIPIASWNWKTEDPSIRHIGPMAQDFHAAFGVGGDETRITTVDADGVALAAIQGLDQVIEEKDARIATLEKRMDTLASRSPGAGPGGGVLLALIGALSILVLGLGSLFARRGLRTA